MTKNTNTKKDIFGNQKKIIKRLFPMKTIKKFIRRCWVRVEPNAALAWDLDFKKDTECN